MKLLQEKDAKIQSMEQTHKAEIRKTAKDGHDKEG